jgi:protein-tyrosine-phosphatase
MQDRNETRTSERAGPSGGGRLRAAARALRHAPDRALHPLRRRIARWRLSRMGLPRSVVFVCTGNICRSPYAAHAFVAVLPQELREFMIVGSAGFVGPDRRTPENGLFAASAHGVDLRAHRSHVLNPDLVQGVDLLVVMETEHRDRLLRSFAAPPNRIIVLGDLDPEPIDTRTVRDPIFQEVEVFTDTYARIDRCLAELYRALADEEPASRTVRSAAARPAERDLPFMNRARGGQESSPRGETSPPNAAVAPTPH